MGQHKRGPKPGSRSVSIDAKIGGNNPDLAADLAAELNAVARRIRKKWKVSISCSVEAPSFQ